MSRGFTLIEVLITVMIGAATVVAAAKVAETLVLQSNRGRQANDYAARNRLLGRQLREDLRVAGLGSTGAVAISAGDAMFAGLPYGPTPAGYNAMPAVSGVNSAAGGANVRPGSDALQLVVPNPSTTRFTSLRARRNQNALDFAAGDATLFQNCPMVYVSDQSSPSGGGRVGLFGVNSVVAGARVTVNAPLPFTVAPGSQVMCARVSTYYVDDQALLHRSDWAGGGLTTINGAVGQVLVDLTSDQVMAAGIEDMQIAYRMSSELYVRGGGAPPVGNPDAQWVFAGDAGNADGEMGPDWAWYEVRQVRFNLLARRLRRVGVTSSQSQLEVEAREDGNVRDMIRASSPDWLTSSEVVMNLRLFDMGAPSGLEAEPY